MNIAMTRFTILGAGGYLGRALAARLEEDGHSVHAVTRASLPALLDCRRPVGHVIDCIGLTGDFRSRPFDTAQAHVGITAQCLATLNCDSFLFVSSTRIYAHAVSAQEETPIITVPTDPSDVFNLSKLAGEALCFCDPRPTRRVVRLSNVYGPGLGNDTFLGQVLAEGQTTGAVRFRQASDSEKDYVSLQQVLRLLPLIATHGAARLYNLATGRNTTHASIASALRDSFGWDTAFEPDAPSVRFPRIATARLEAEFGRGLSDLLTDLRTIATPIAEVPCSPSTRLPTR